MDFTSLARSYTTALACILLLVITWKLLGILIHRYLTMKATVTYDIPNLGIFRPDNQRVKGTAVICGGSIAGLWAARVCADHFEDVLLVEPDQVEGYRNPVHTGKEEPDASDTMTRMKSRTRVSQYTAAHVFYPLMMRALKKYFPQIKLEIERADGRVTPTAYHVHAYGGQLMSLHPDELNDPKEFEEFFISREGYERILRSLVLESSKRIRCMTGTAIGFTNAGSNSNSIDSVRIRTLSRGEISAPAALVIDCTGGTQAGFKWHRRLSETKTRSGDDSTISNLRITYRTNQRYKQFRFYVPPEARQRLPIPDGYDNAAFIYTIFPRPGLDKTYFFIHRLEGHRTQFYFTGWGNPLLPEDFTDLRDFLVNFNENESIPGWIIELVDILLKCCDQAEKNPGVYPELSWIRYEKATSLPSNFVAIGDAVMRANPVFGQGCTKAAVGAITLDSLLRSPRLWNISKISDGFGREFFKKHAQKIASAWNGTKPFDYQWESTDPVQGERLEDEWFNAGFSKLIIELATRDSKVDFTLVKVRALLAPPTDLMHPRILAKVALLWLMKRLNLV